MDEARREGDGRCWPQAPRRLALGGIPGRRTMMRRRWVDGRGASPMPIGVGFGSALSRLFGEVSQDPAGFASASIDPSCRGIGWPWLVAAA
jgi:hypothetical protein